MIRTMEFITGLLTPSRRRGSREGGRCSSREAIAERVAGRSLDLQDPWAAVRRIQRPAIFPPRRLLR